jgi:hypothetical protein
VAATAFLERRHAAMAPVLYDFLGVENTLRDDRFDLHLGLSKAFGDFAVTLSEQRRVYPYCPVAAGKLEPKITELRGARQRL